MSDLRLAVPTEKSPERLRADMERLLEEGFAGDMLTGTWKGETLHLKGPGAEGAVALEDGEIVGRATLRPPASFLRATIEEKFRELLERVARD